MNTMDRFFEINQDSNLHTIWRTTAFRIDLGWSYTMSCCWWNKSGKDYYVCFDIVCAWLSTSVEHNSIGSSLVEAGREEIWSSYSVSNMANFRINQDHRDHWDNNLHTNLENHRNLIGLDWSYAMLSCWLSRSAEDYYVCFDIVEKSARWGSIKTIETTICT